MVLAAGLVLIQAGSITVTPPSFTTAREPQIAIDQDERVYVVFGAGDAIFVSISSDLCSSYGPPVRVAESGKLSLGMRRGPRIAAHKGTITVTTVYGAQGKGRDGDVVAFQSNDKGATWTGPVRVNDVGGSAREGLHAMAVGPDGTLACTWLDLRSRGTRLYFATSRDGGSTWSEDRLVYTSPSGAICECCHPSMAFDSSGKLHVMFRNSLEGARDMYVASSSDLKSFSPARKVGQGAWMISACPMDGGMLAVGSDGTVRTVWRRENEIYEATSDGKERSLGEGRNPWMAIGTAGRYLAWQNGREIFFSMPGVGHQRVSQQGNDPVIASSPNGKLVIGAWTRAVSERFG